MEIVLYNTKNDDNVINKELNELYRFNIKLKNDVYLINPTIILNDKGSMNFRLCNYCWIEEFDRFYFIRNVRNITNNIRELVLECDVLETFKNDILNGVGEYTREITSGDYQNTNTNVDVRKTIDIYDSDVQLELKNTLLLSTLGK